MTITWSELTHNAYSFVHAWRDYTGKEIAGTQPFWSDFFRIFGRDRRSLKVEFEYSVPKANGQQGRIDVFWPGMLLVEQKRPGIELSRATTQAFEYLDGLEAHQKAKYIIVCNFHDFILFDLSQPEGQDELHFTLDQLPGKLEHFIFFTGAKRHQFYDNNAEASIKASQAMAKLYELIYADNRHTVGLETFMVRLLYCLFADDTEIFEPNYFHRYLDERTAADGSDLGMHLTQIFELLDKPETERSPHIPKELAAFPYINGELFSERIEMPFFNAKMREAILELCGLDWSIISPAIFGALFQNISDEKKRRTLGEHYTSEANILKVINPLFLDELKERLAQAGQNKKKLEALHRQMASLTFLDPACGCGNFLVTAYRHLRELEIELIQRQFDGQKVLNIESLMQVNIHQFYGIEVAEFPARIAQVALWLTDHQMNRKASKNFGKHFKRIPLSHQRQICCANALRIDWATIIEPSRLNYIIGNPPFVGARMKNASQKEEIEAIFAKGKGRSDLDYVACWYKKSAMLMQRNGLIRAGLVSTNSVVQGAHVAPLWLPLLNDEQIEINFAHRTFSWSNEAGNEAKVHCVIIGFSRHGTSQASKRLWDYPDIKGQPIEHVVGHINPYLLDAPDIVVQARSTPLNPLTNPMVFGSMPNDGGHLLLSQAERAALLQAEPAAAAYIRPLLGSQEFIHNQPRYCLWLKDAEPQALAQLPLVQQRIKLVKQYREASDRKATRDLAQSPTLFGEMRQPLSDYLLIPAVSSERRIYVPIGYVNQEVISTNRNFTIANATPYLFGLLTSLMHNTWLKYTCGRLESRFNYSNTIVYNNFPFPYQASQTAQAKVTAQAEALLSLRQAYLDRGNNYANLYDPNLMPADLLKAHKALDKAVDQCYGLKGNLSEMQRIAFLFEEYKKYSDPLFQYDNQQ